MKKSAQWFTVSVFGFLGTTEPGLLLSHHLQMRMSDMDREHVKGAADKAKGVIKEGAGKLTGDKDLEAEGKIDKAKGSAHKAAGDVKDGLRDVTDALKK